MKLYNRMRYDLFENAFKNKKYFTVPIFVLLYCIQTEGYLYNLVSDVRNSIGDYYLLFLRGTDPYSVTKEMNYPIFWMAYLIIGFFITTGVLQKDLQGYGVQLLLRFNKKREWWLCKCITTIIMSILYCVLTDLLVFFFCLAKKCKLSLLMTNSVIETVANNTYAFPQDHLLIDPVITVMLLIVLPMVIFSTLNILQLFLSIVTGPLISFIIINGYMVMALFYVSPFILPSYLMIDHTSVFIKGGLDYRVGIMSGLLLMVGFVIMGARIFSKRDIFERESNDD